MTEYVAQMVPMLVIAGAMVAWLAQMSWTAGGFGFLPDMALGLAGSMLVVAVVASAEAGMLGIFGMGGAGAVLAIAAQRGLWRSAPARS
jgi:hypothetical protein